MALYKQEAQTQPQQSVLCHTGYIISERITLRITEESSTLDLGMKRFHCLRRFSLDKLKGQCDNCMRDMDVMYFFLEKQYYSRELMELIIKTYKEDAVGNCPKTSFWPGHRYFDKVLAAMNPKNQEKIVEKDHYQIIEEKQDGEVSF